MKNSSVFAKSQILCLLAFVSALVFLAACQQSAPYHKLDNEGAVPRISIEEAKADFDAGRAIIVDARGEANWNQERIKDSINIPAGSPEEKFSVLPKGKKIIVYCS